MIYGSVGASAYTAVMAEQKRKNNAKSAADANPKRNANGTKKQVIVNRKHEDSKR